MSSHDIMSEASLRPDDVSGPVDATVPVSEAQIAKYPYTSDLFDPMVHSGVRIQELLMRMRFGTSTSLIYLQIRKPRPVRNEIATQNDKRFIDSLGSGMNPFICSKEYDFVVDFSLPNAVIGKDCSNIV